MTDRVQTLTVVLEHDMRDDDARDLAKMLNAVRGVGRVELGPVVSPVDWLARERAKRELREKLWEELAPGAAFREKMARE